MTDPEQSRPQSDEEIAEDASQAYYWAKERTQTEGDTWRQPLTDPKSREIHLLSNTRRIYKIINTGAYGVNIEGFDLADPTETGIIGPVSLSHKLMLNVPSSEIAGYCRDMVGTSPTYLQLGPIARDLKPGSSRKITEAGFTALTQGRDQKG